MKFYRVISLLAAATAACVGYVTVAASAISNRVSRWLRPHIEALSVAFREPKHLPRPAAMLVQACAYWARQVKRSRPIVTPRWRMCPSA